MALPFAGAAIKEVVAKASAKEPVAVLILDACRFDLGCRLAEGLNQGEPTRRAEVSAARAPIPSITALGMPLLPPGPGRQDPRGDARQVRNILAGHCRWRPG